MARVAVAWAFTLAVVGTAAPAGAQTWQFVPSIGAQETATNNVDLSPSATRQSDFVTQLTPALTFTERGDHTKLDGFISVPILLYARTSQENNNAYPSAGMVGDVALIDRIFHIEGAISVAQQFYSAFGAQPISLDNASANRYRTDSYRVSPYIAGTTSGGTSYEVRNNNVWTNLSGAPIESSNAYYTEFLANAANTERTLGWRANYDYNNVQFDNGNSIRTQIGRLVPVYKVDPQFRVEGIIGYEENRYQLTSSSDVVYGVALEYDPTERAKLIANYEHRFFGGSYLLSFANRTPLSVWSLQASRNITTYPQQLASLPVGVDVSAFLNNLFLTSIPDATARQQAVDQLIQARGLPPTLSGPVNLYTQQILLQQGQSASIALIGARNSILFSVFNLKSTQITAEGTPVPPIIGINSNNTQTGGSIVWTNKLTAATLLTTSFNAYRTVANYTDFPGTTKQGVAQVMLSTPLSAKTTVFVGGRYQVLQSDVTPDYNEAAVFAGLTYTFK